MASRSHPWNTSGLNSSVVTDPTTGYLAYVAVTSCTLGDVADGVKRSRTYSRYCAGGTPKGIPKIGSGALQGLQVASTGTESPVRKRIVTFVLAGTVAFQKRPVHSARPPAAMGADTRRPWELGVV